LKDVAGVVVSNYKIHLEKEYTVTCPIIDRLSPHSVIDQRLSLIRALDLFNIDLPPGHINFI
jgi:hypothetical protein